MLVWFFVLVLSGPVISSRHASNVGQISRAGSVRRHLGPNRLAIIIGFRLVRRYRDITRYAAGGWIRMYNWRRWRHNGLNGHGHDFLHACRNQHGAAAVCSTKTDGSTKNALAGRDFIADGFGQWLSGRRRSIRGTLRLCRQRRYEISLIRHRGTDSLNVRFLPVHPWGSSFSGKSCFCYNLPVVAGSFRLWQHRARS
jgi:hypothetical protein